MQNHVVDIGDGRCAVICVGFDADIFVDVVKVCCEKLCQFRVVKVCCENFAEKHDSKFLSSKKGTTPGVYVFLHIIGKSDSFLFIFCD